MPPCVQALPDGYRPLLTLDLRKDKQALRGVCLSSLLLLVILAAVGLRFSPLSGLFSREGDAAAVVLRWLVMAAGLFAYIPLHELTHGLCMCLFGASRVRYRLTLAYACAGSDDYFSKRAYAVVALVPAALWGVMLLAAQFAVPAPWFWCVYAVQLFNISGSAGDFYVVWRFRRLLPSALIQDDGACMSVFSPDA